MAFQGVMDKLPTLRALLAKQPGEMQSQGLEVWRSDAESCFGGPHGGSLHLPYAYDLCTSVPSPIMGKIRSSTAFFWIR